MSIILNTGSTDIWGFIFCASTFSMTLKRKILNLMTLKRKIFVQNFVVVHHSNAQHGTAGYPPLLLRHRNASTVCG